MRARALIGELAQLPEDGIILWRGSRLDGRDIDLLILPSAEKKLARRLADVGYLPSRSARGRTVWTAADGGEPELDTMAARAWPHYYPSVAGVRARAVRAPDLPPVASAEDRLLIFAAEAIAGRPMRKVVERASALLASPGTRTRLFAVAAEENMPELARLIAEPTRLAAMERRGRLPYRRALPLALRSGAARSALRRRLAGRLGRATRGLPRGPWRRDRLGLLIALSGMDGAGKSTAAQAIKTHLAAAGHPAVVTWGRVAADLGPLDRLARVVRRLLRRQGSVADPVAAGRLAGDKAQHARDAEGRRPLVSWIWIVLVAAANARYLWRAARPRRGGVAVVSDRWLVDSLVDLEVRYGRHRAAEWALSATTPRADVAIFLEIDTATSLRRKPGDQAPRVLQAMERHYSATAARHGTVRIDARSPSLEVERALREVVDSVLEHRAARDR